MLSEESGLPPNTVLLRLDLNQPVDVGLNHQAVQLIAREHSAYEVSFRSAGGCGNQPDDIVRTIKHGYWPLITKRSVVLVDQSEPCKVLSAVICIPFQSLDLDLTRNIVQAIRTNDKATLSSSPTPLTEFMISEKYPEIVWLLAECDHAALASASTNPYATKFSQYVAHEQALKEGDQHWIEEFGMIASERDAPLGSMTGTITVLLKRMWEAGVKMAIGHYNNYSASIALRTGGQLLCRIEHRDAESLKRRPNEPCDAPRFQFMQTVLDERHGYPTESVIVHDLDELAESFHWKNGRIPHSNGR